MSLRMKLLVAQVPLAVALAVVGVVAALRVSSLGQRSGTILHENYRSVLAAERMRESLERLQDRAVLSLVTGVSTDTPATTTHAQQFEHELRAAEANITEVGEGDALRELRRRWEAYRDQLQRLVTLQAAGDARELVLSALEPAAAAVRQQAQLILEINQDAMVRKSERAQQEAARVGTLLISAAVGALLLGVLLSGMVTSRLLQPFELLARTVARLGEGDFDTRVNIAGNDEVARLAKDINAMATHLGQYRRSSLGELLLAQEASQAAIDSLPDPVAVFDLNGSVLNANRAAETAIGLKLDAGEGGPLDAADADVRALLERVRTHVLSGKGPYVPRGFDEAVRVAARDGERYLLPRATPVHSVEGTIIGVAVILQDVTRLRRVDDLRNDLVSTVAHEFRTPLTSLRMAVHLCLEQTGGPLTERQADLLYAAREECERLQAMVDELLDLARIQSGRVELHRTRVTPMALIEAAIDAHRGMAEEHHLLLESAAPSGLGSVLADRERLQLVLSNLLTNAIRHTPPGGQITVGAQAVGEQRLRFTVADTGPGIPPEYRSSIFEKFVRIPGTPGGSGLGLSIAKEVIEAHDGEIGVEETPGGGATFWFTVPIAPSTSDPAPDPVLADRDAG